VAFSLSRWRARHLLLAWGVYWLVLVGAMLSSALLTSPVRETEHDLRIS
jgi:uncharacterized membrane protein YiaA